MPRTRTPSPPFGGGGDFAGAGAGGTWEGAPPLGSRRTRERRSQRRSKRRRRRRWKWSSGGGGRRPDSTFDARREGCVFFLLAVALIVAGLLASLYVVYAAPTLLAELLVEGLLLSGLYRGMKKGAQQGDWLRAVVRRTWLPVLLTLALFAAAGYMLQRAAPRARSIGEAWRTLGSD